MPLAKKVGEPTTKGPSPTASAPPKIVTATVPTVNARPDVVDRATNGGGVLRPGSIGGLKTFAPEDITSRVNLLLYGEPGIGKTRLAASACLVEIMSPVLVINVEKGAKTLKGSYRGNPNLTIIEPQTFGQVQRVFDDLLKHKGGGFNTVIFDNATEGQKVGIEYIFDEDKVSTDFTDFETASWKNQGWNRSSEQMRKMIRYFKMLPMHTIFIAWRKDYSKDDKSERWGPAFSNALAREIPGMFDSVFYYKWAKINNQPARVLQTVGTDTVVAKDRDDGNTLPNTVVDPTMQKLCELWGYL